MKNMKLKNEEKYFVHYGSGRQKILKTKIMNKVIYFKQGEDMSGEEKLQALEDKIIKDNQTPFNMDKSFHDLAKKTRDILFREEVRVTDTIEIKHTQGNVDEGDSSGTQK